MPTPSKLSKIVPSTMREFKRGELHSGVNGPVVKNPKQALAIALAKKRRASGGGVSKR